MGGWQREAESSVKVVKATIAGGLSFLLPLVLVVLLLSHALRFGAKAVRPISEFLTLDKVFGPAAEGIRAHCSHALSPQCHAFDGKFISRRAAAIPAGQNCAEGFAQIEKCRKFKTRSRKHRGRVADRVFAGITSDRLGCRLRPTGTNTYVGQCNVSARRTRAASGHLNGRGHVTRKAHGDRFFEGPGRRGSRASRGCLNQS